MEFASFDAAKCQFLAFVTQNVWIEKRAKPNRYLRGLKNIWNTIKVNLIIKKKIQDAMYFEHWLLPNRPKEFDIRDILVIIQKKLVHNMYFE